MQINELKGHELAATSIDWKVRYNLKFMILILSFRKWVKDLERYLFHAQMIRQ